MKKKVFYILIFVISIFIIDFIIGVVLQRVVLSLPDANMETTNAKNALVGHSGEIVILGASRSNHHYDPNILQDTLGMNVFNGGMDGTDVIFSWAVFQSAIDVQKPKIVIFDINPQQFNGDFTKHFKNYTFMYGASKPYSEAFDSIADIYDKIKMVSQMYKYNSRLIWFATAYMKGNVGGSGYKPLSGTDTNLRYKDSHDIALFKMDAKCQMFFNRIVETCKKSDIQLIICYSPSLYKSSDGFLNYMGKYCQENDIIFLNYENDTTYTNHPEYFVDHVHMNATGAEIFSREVASVIKRRVK